jgi:hypothetical protein
MYMLRDCAASCLQNEITGSQVAGLTACLQALTSSAPKEESNSKSIWHDQENKNCSQVLLPLLAFVLWYLPPLAKHQVVYLIQKGSFD